MNKDEGRKSEHRLNAGARVIITAGAEVVAGKPKVKNTPGAEEPNRIDFNELGRSQNTYSSGL